MNRYIVLKNRFLALSLFLIVAYTPVGAQQWTVYPQTGAGLPITFKRPGIFEKNVLAIDKENTVWMNFSAKVVRYSPASGAWQEMIPAGVSAIFADLEGNIHVKQGNQILRYDGAGFTGLFTEPINSIYDFAADSDGNLWYTPGKSGPVVKKFDGTALTEFALPVVIHPCCVNMAVPLGRESNNTLWTVITDLDAIDKLVEVNGTRVYDNTHSEIFNYPIFSLEVLRNNTIWVGTFPFDRIPPRGVAYLDRPSDTWTLYNKSNSPLPGDTVLYVKGDYQNRVWISTSRGLARFDGTAWKTFDSGNSPLPSDTSTAIAIDTLGAKWFATPRGLARFNEIAPAYDVKHCGLSVTFADRSESIDGDVVARHWDFAGLSASTSPSPTFVFPGPGSYPVSLWVRDEKGNRNIMTQTIEVREPAEVLSLGPDINACTPSVPLASNITNADSYTWQTPDGTVTAHAITATVPGRYILAVDTQGCLQKDTIQVLLNSFTAGSFDMTVGNAAWPLTGGIVLTQVEISFTNTTGSGENFTWSFGEGTTVTGQSAKHAYANPGDYQVTLAGNDDRDCPIIVEKTIHVEDIGITNAISPDGDGKNDKLFIEPFLYEAELTVLNRWGQPVYESAPYQDDFTGASLESGVYYYELYFKAIDKRYKGYVHILKQ
ncbi:PKD domain-containing protein [Dawidia soli]|uniref:PKD domain-containing protein n=1 Tax=Dawidia soli TaxID=2782352 RepID=A0AAP2GJ84_9BACT|nr:PKD domain-containing protein [Dawidia soli]MBT1689136.1 PKD domain-containing protein [Dawidia soli]